MLHWVSLSVLPLRRCRSSGKNDKAWIQQDLFWCCPHFVSRPRKTFNFHPLSVAGIFYWGSRLRPSEAMAVLGAAVRNVMEDTKGISCQQPDRAVAFCPYQARHTAQFVPYLLSTAPIFFKTVSELFHRLLGVKCKCTTSLTIQEAVWDGFISIFSVSLRSAWVFPGIPLFRDVKGGRNHRTPNLISCIAQSRCFHLKTGQSPVTWICLKYLFLKAP